MLKLLTAITIAAIATAATTTSAQAEDCLTIQTERIDKKPAMPGMQGVDPKLLSPEVRKMIEAQNAPAKPFMETTYWTPNQVITVTSDQTTITNYDTMTMTGINHAQKTYHTMQLGKLMDTLGMTAPKQMKAKAKAAPIKVASTAPQATGNKMTIAGIECTEFKVRIDNNANEFMKTMRPKVGKSNTPEIKIYTVQTRCVSATQPEAYFRIRKIQEEKFMKSLPPATQEKIKALVAAGDAGEAGALIGGLISYQGKGMGAEIHKGFELKSQIQNKSEVATKDARLKEQMEKMDTGTTRTVKSIATSCPPASVTITPANYKNVSMGVGGAPQMRKLGKGP